jgi:hypothetical protein
MAKHVWMWVLAAGCATDPVTVASHDIREQSGTRLKVEWWELAGGEMQVRGVYDTLLDRECALERQVDGTFRCGEVSATFDLQHAATRVVATSVCTDDGLILPLGFYDTLRDRECTAGARPDGELGCTPLGAEPSNDDPAVAITSEPAPGMRLAPRFLVAADGLHQHLPSFDDAGLATPCSVLGPADRLAFCLPFTDAALPFDRYVAALPSVDP